MTADENLAEAIKRVDASRQSGDFDGPVWGANADVPSTALEQVNNRRIVEGLKTYISAWGSGVFPEIPSKALEDAVDAYLQDLKSSGAVLDAGVHAWGAPRTPITIKDDRPVSTSAKVHRAVYVYAEGRFMEIKFRRMSWRKAKPRIKRFLAREKDMLRMDMTIYPVNPREYLTMQVRVAPVKEAA